ncbi:hypothetical protein ACVR1I_06545 [Streptococcus cameli]
MTFTGIKSNGKTTLEIRLSDDQLEHVANGGTVTLDISPLPTFEKVTISQTLINDVTNSIVNRDRTLISKQELAIKGMAKDSFQMGVR